MGNRPAVLGSWEINRKEWKPFGRVVELSVLLLVVVTMILCLLKLTELTTSKSRLTECRIDFAFHNAIGKGFFPKMSTQCSLYGVTQGSLTSLTLVALTLAWGCP